MKIQIDINLDDIYTDYGSVGELVRHEVEQVIVAHIRKAIKDQMKVEEKKLQELVKQAKKVSLEKALEQLKSLQ